MDLKAKSESVSESESESESASSVVGASEKKNFTLEDESSSVWSSEERALLLAAVKQFGMLNVEHLASILKTKTVQQIKEFFKRVTRAVHKDRHKMALKRARRKLARYERNNLARRMLARKNIPKTGPLKKVWEKLLLAQLGHGPIDWWLNHIKQITKAQSPTVTEMIPRAFSIIAQYEDHPHPSLCGGVDFREAYDYLYHVLSGVPPKSLLPPTAQFIQRSIRRLLQSLKDGMYSPDYSGYFGAQLNYLQAASSSSENKTPGQTYGASRKAYMHKSGHLLNSSQAIKRLMSNISFNPLKVPESLAWRKEHVPSNVNPSDNLKPMDQRKFKTVESVGDAEDITIGLFGGTSIYRGHCKTPRN